MTISRRQALAGLGLLSASAGAAALVSSAAARPSGRLEELIADWRYKAAEEDELFERYEALLKQLPARHIEHVYRAGQTKIFTDEEQIDRAYGIGIPIEHDRGTREKHAAAVSAFRRQMRLYRAARKRLRVDEAERLADGAWRAKMAAQDAIFAYSPATIAEARERSAFILARVNENHDFTDDHWRMIFAAGSVGVA